MATTEPGKFVLMGTKPSPIASTSSASVSPKPCSSKEPPYIISEKSSAKLLKRGRKVTTTKSTKTKRVIQGRLVQNGAIFDGKYNEITENHESITDILRKRSKVLAAIEESRKHYAKERKIYEKVRCGVLKLEKEIEKIKLQILKYNQVIAELMIEKQ